MPPKRESKKQQSPSSSAPSSSSASAPSAPPAASSSPFEMKFYPLDGTYIGKIDVNDEKALAKNSAGIETIIVLDQSGSMSHFFNRILTVVIPSVLQRLHVPEDQIVKLILFQSRAKSKDYTIKSFKNSNELADGGTNFEPALKELEKVIDRVDAKKKIRILTISDGAIGDKARALVSASLIANQFKTSRVINSQGVRLYTSDYGEPDTAALASVLQLNTHKDAQLLDIMIAYATDEQVVDQIVPLFATDGFDFNLSLKSEEKNITLAPWRPYTNAVSLLPGENILWFASLPKLTLNGKPIKVIERKDASADEYQAVVKNKVVYYLNQLKLLKIVNTPASLEEIKNILNYFEKFESIIESKSSDLIKVLQDNSLRSRLTALKMAITKRQSSQIALMRQIANDEKVAKLNSAQQAAYLREVNVSKNAKGLASKILKHGLDFDNTLRQEVKKMHENIKEINDIDDSAHKVSFYSTSTTLEGIRAVCSLITEGMLDDVGAMDIIKMINLVGVACDAPVGEYPDAMTYRVNDIFCGAYISVSDILTAYETSGGEALTAPGLNKSIVNAIPIFDDEKIHLFLKKYAPSLLELSAGIGMRRVMGLVPMTHSYTCCAGVWAMVEQIQKSKSEINIVTFHELARTYKTAIGTYFAHVLPHIKPQDAKLSYYIANNGITNMISPLITLTEQKNTQYFPHILRALFSYEYYQVVKKLFRDAENNPLYNQTLIQLLGIDLEKHATPLPPPFEEAKSEVIQHYNQYTIDEKLLDKIISRAYYVDYVVSFVKLLDMDARKIKEYKDLDEKSIVESLGLGKMKLRKFKFYCSVQGLLFPEKQSRVDQDKEVMKLVEIGDEKLAEEMVQNFVVEQYKAKYLADLAKKSAKEKEELTAKLVKDMAEAKTTGEFVRLFREGLTQGTCNVIIKTSSANGAQDLFAKLVDKKVHVPERTKKIGMFLLAKDEEGKVIWNNGSVFAGNLKLAADVVITTDSAEEWEKIATIYKKNRRHVYREAPNAKGHSNDKPSYWALGYPSIDAMSKEVSNLEWVEYQRQHSTCCGLYKGSSWKLRRFEKSQKKK